MSENSYKLWTVIEEFFAGNRKMLRISCPDCGYQYVVRKTDYRKERSCRKCRFVVSNRSNLGKHRGSGDLTKTFYNYFRFVAKKREIPFDVSIEYLWNLAIEQDMKCALTGLPIEFPTVSGLDGNSQLDENAMQRVRTGSGKVNVASLDRKDSSVGYIEGNVQWVTKWINIMKNGLSQDEFIYLCHLVASRHVNPEPSCLLGFPYGRGCRQKVQRLESETSQSIIFPRAPDALLVYQEGDDIVRHSEEIRRVLA